jgi:hypothetical protein
MPVMMEIPRQFSHADRPDHVGWRKREGDNQNFHLIDRIGAMIRTSFRLFENRLQLP